MVKQFLLGDKKRYPLERKNMTCVLRLRGFQSISNTQGKTETNCLGKSKQIVSQPLRQSDELLRAFSESS